MPTGFAGSTRKARLPYDWETRRRLALERCGGRCEHRDESGRCRERATDVDHIRRGDDHSMGNLQGLCRRHHRTKTGREGADARPKLRRAVPRHPGLV